MDNIQEEDYAPVPPFLYIIFDEKEVYYFDTNRGRAVAYLDYLSKRVKTKKFSIDREENPVKIKELW